MTFDEITMRAGRDVGVRMLETAAAQVRDKGWRRDGYGPAEGPNCVMGALRLAACQVTCRQGLPGHTETGYLVGLPGHADTGYLAAQRALVRAVGDRDPISWNDHVCPDEETAVDALLTAAKELANVGT